MKKKLSPLSKEVAEEIDAQLSDCKNDCRSGRLSGDTLRVISQTVLKILDTWTPRLNYATRCEVLDWFQRNYGLCL